MSNAILSLIPAYGPWIVFVTVLLGCLAIPLPGSMLVLASGSFAAAGDVSLSETVTAAFCGYVVGDQTAFRLARIAGPRLLERFRQFRKADTMISQAEQLLRRRGVAAVFLSRTIVSPLGPWMSYLCGAAGLSWIHFTKASLAGAVVWVAGYSGLGYLLADRVSDLENLVSDGLGLIATLSIAAGSAWWLHGSWKRYKKMSRDEDLSKSENTVVGQINDDTV